MKISNAIKEKLKNIIAEKKSQEKKPNIPLYGKDAKLVSGDVFRLPIGDAFRSLIKYLKTKSSQKHYLSPIKSGIVTFEIKNTLKKAVITFLALGIYFSITDIYVNSQNKANTITDDFSIGNVIEDELGNNIEIDENGQINPYPINKEEQNKIIENFKKFSADQFKNWNIDGEISKIISVDSLQINEVVTAGTFMNYLVTVKLEVIDERENTNVIEMQFFADQDFVFSTSDQSDIDKLNEVMAYLNNPDMCGIYNVTTMSDMAEEIKNLLIERGNKNIYFVGDVIWAQRNSGDIIYKIPVYNNDGTITIWSTTIDKTLDIDAEGLAPEQAFLNQLEGNGDYFSASEETNNTDLITINSILSEFQQDQENASDENNLDDEEEDFNEK